MIYICIEKSRSRFVKDKMFFPNETNAELFYLFTSAKHHLLWDKVSFAFNVNQGTIKFNK